MNKQRRDKLRRAINFLDAAKDIVADVKWEEQDALDAIPENLQGSERYESIENALDALNDAEGSIQEATESLETACE